MQKQKEYLSYNELLKFIKEMSYSTGLYGRLYRDITENEDILEKFKNLCEEKKFKTTMDFIFWFEC